MSPAATAGRSRPSVTVIAARIGTARTSSWARVCRPMPTTLPTRIWLGRSTARSTSAIRVDFSTPTFIAMLFPLNMMAM